MRGNKMFFEEFGHEIELAAQEWGIEKGLRLFGFTEFYGISKAATETPVLRGYFIDPNYKVLTMLYFIPKVTRGKITLAKAGHLDKEKPAGYKWPIKIMRTKTYITEKIEPVDPLYEVLLSRKIILPFQSTMKDREWAALPFEDAKGIKPTAIQAGYGGEKL
jgi:hypothetical protein